MASSSFPNRPLCIPLKICDQTSTVHILFSTLVFQPPTTFLIAFQGFSTSASDSCLFLPQINTKGLRTWRGLAQPQPHSWYRFSELVVFYVAVVNYLTVSSLRREELNLTHSMRLYSLKGKHGIRWLWWQNCIAGTP